MRANLFITISVFLSLYFIICILLYFFQEKVIFFPQKLADDYSFQFDNFEEQYIKMKDGKILHGLLFKAETPKGLVYYLHGNAGSLAGWGAAAEIFTDLDYNVFMLDYRGYGKSEGAIESEIQLHQDIQSVYDHLINKYPENEMVVLGHSIGSGMAAKVAARNNPKLLILQAPLYSLPDLASRTTPFQIFPPFLTRYKFRTGKYVKESEMPVAVLHGDEDEIINYSSSLKLKQEFKPEDTLITLKGLGHNDFLFTLQYHNAIKKILEMY